MPLRIKIQTAIVITLVFTFRLFYANVCITESQPSSKTSQFISSHFKSILKKRKRSPETIVSNKMETTSGQEVFEETTDKEEEPSKGDAPVILSYLYSLLADNAGAFSPGNSSVHHNYSLLPKKYLAFSILRI
ncbi:MAG: hypothetical protein ACXVPN_11195 [Bacteroidia bacterium]